MYKAVGVAVSAVLLVILAILVLTKPEVKPEVKPKETLEFMESQNKINKTSKELFEIQQQRISNLEMRIDRLEGKDHLVPPWGQLPQPKPYQGPVDPRSKPIVPGVPPPGVPRPKEQ